MSLPVITNVRVGQGLEFERGHNSPPGLLSYVPLIVTHRLPLPLLSHDVLRDWPGRQRGEHHKR